MSIKWYKTTFLSQLVFVDIIHVVLLYLVYTLNLGLYRTLYYPALFGCILLSYLLFPIVSLYMQRRCPGVKKSSMVDKVSYGCWLLLFFLIAWGNGFVKTHLTQAYPDGSANAYWGHHHILSLITSGGFFISSYFYSKIVSTKDVYL